MRDLVAISAVWLAAALLLRPFQNTPFIDDWVYGWSVEHLLNGGGLRVLDYSTSLNPVQVLWGALFCLPFGFSFAALRVATWLLALLGLCGMYVLLRDVGVRRLDALLGTACLGAFPVYFVLSFSFMTDIPVVTCEIWGTVAFLRAARRRSDAWLWTAVAVGSAGAGVRLPGAVLPIAMSLALLFGRDGWGRKKARFLWPAIGLAVAGAVAWWVLRHVVVVADLTQLPGAPMYRVRLLEEEALRFLPVLALSATTFLAGAVGLAVLPLSAGIVTRRRVLVVLIVMAALWACVGTARALKQSYPALLTAGQTWWPGELGATEPLVPDYEKPAAPAWWVWGVMAVTLASASVVLERCVRRPGAPGAFLTLQVLGHLLLIALLWLLYDRYALVVVPLGVALMLHDGRIVRPRLTAAVVFLMALASLVGVRDHLAYNRALWAAVTHAEALGIQPAELDGGYVVNGWLQYAHPDRARRNATGGVEVPSVNVRATPRYRISNGAPGGWNVIASFPYTRWVGRSGRIYVLER